MDDKFEDNIDTKGLNLNSSPNSIHLQQYALVKLEDGDAALVMEANESSNIAVNFIKDESISDVEAGDSNQEKDFDVNALSIISEHKVCDEVADRHCNYNAIRVITSNQVKLVPMPTASKEGKNINYPDDSKAGFNVDQMEVKAIIDNDSVVSTSLEIKENQEEQEHFPTESLTIPIHCIENNHESTTTTHDSSKSHGHSSSWSNCSNSDGTASETAIGIEARKNLTNDKLDENSDSDATIVDDGTYQACHSSLNADNSHLVVKTAAFVCDKVLTTANKKLKSGKQEEYRVCKQKVDHSKSKLALAKDESKEEATPQCRYCQTALSSNDVNRRRTRSKQAIYSCNMCNCILSTKNKHVRKNNNSDAKKTLKNAFVCEDCGKSFPKKTNLKSHMLSHVSRPFKCKKCGKAFIEHEKLKRHELIHNDNRPFACKHYHKRFILNSNLDQNMEKHAHDVNRPFSCTKCTARFSSSFSLHNHMMNTHIEKPFECMHCGQKFRTSSDLEDHKNAIHPVRPIEKPPILIPPNKSKSQSVLEPRHIKVLYKFNCVICNSKFITDVQLYRHMREHSGLKPYPCKECGKDFSLQSELKQHMLLHGKVLVCKRCGFLCKWKTTLVKHMATHTEEKPYPCNVCGMAWSTNASLLRHQRRHTKTHTWICCEVCGENFEKNKELAIHMKFHYRERLFICEKCGKTFASKKVLKNHMKSHNN